MTTTEPEGASWRDWSEWWAHRTGWAIVALFGVGIGTILLGWPRWAWTVICVGTIMVLKINMTIHSCLMCFRCITQIPAQPEASLRRRRWALWLYHHNFLIFACWFMTWVATDYVPKTVQGLFVIGYFAGMVLLATVEILHRPLSPWLCPYCPQWGGGGDGEDETTPAPSPQPVGVEKK